MVILLLGSQRRLGSPMCNQRNMSWYRSRWWPWLRRLWWRWVVVGAELRAGKVRAAVEYEKKMHSTNLEICGAMEKHLATMAREAEKLRSELANADKRAIAAVLGAGAVAAVNPGPVYAVHQRTLDPGFGGNSLPGHNAVQQGTFDASMNCVYGVPVIPHGPYDIQR